MITQATLGVTDAQTAELDDLLQQAISPEQFYRRYLQIVTGRLPGAAGIHLWILQGRELVPLGGADRGPLLYDEKAEQKDFLTGRIRAATAGERTLLVPAGSEGNHCPYVLVVTPLLHGKGGGAVQGAQICWWPPDSLDEARRAVPVLESFATCCARMVRAQRLESMTQISGQLQLMTQFLGELSASPDTRSLAVSLVNRAREAADCDRCALLAVRPGGRLEVVAISNVPIPDPRSTTGRTLIQLADHARRTGLPALFRKAGEKTEEKGDLSDYFYHSTMEEALVVAVQPADEDLAGLLVLESSQTGFFKPQRSGMIGSVVAQAALPLHQALLREDMPLRNLMERIARWRRLPPEEQKRWRRRRLWIPLVALAAVALLPVRLQFTGEARLLPQQRALAVAQVEGRIAEVLAAAGDRVVEGQPLAQLDDTDLRKQAEIAAQEEARLQAEADRLLALNERAAAQVAQLELQRARRENEFHRGRQALAVIRSPINGVVMTPELRSRQGDALQPGSQLATVGDPSSWELEVNLPEADVAALLARLRDGDAVPVRFKLASIPQKTFVTRLTGTDPVAASSEVVGGRNVFRIVMPLPPEPEYDTLFRTGYTGRARFVIGYRPLAYTTLRRFFNWARVTVLF